MSCSGGTFAADAKVSERPLTIHIISGCAEYKSEESLKEFQSHLEKNFNVRVTASWGKDGIMQLENLDALKEADVLLLFARRMKLAEEQMAIIRKHWEQGKAVVGVRTACHAFEKADNELFDGKVLGGAYQNHFGDGPVKVTTTEKGQTHPILKDVKPFTSRKLYKEGELAVDTVVLQEGDNGMLKQPVSFVHTYHNGRVFFTSLGVQEDFQDENFRRMLVNALFWTANRDVEPVKK
jgi:type 1 glutamine amidotransferase